MKRTILFLIFPALLLASCSSDDDVLPAAPGTLAGWQIRFDIGFAGQGGVHSRAATTPDFKTTWESGDKVGLFIVKGSGGLQSTNWVDNLEMTYDGSTWSYTLPSDKEYYPNDGDELHFYAYYPYDASMTDPTAYTFSVEADQSTEANYNKSDLLTAKTENVARSSIAVPLQFAHALSLVQVEVKREVNVPLFVDADFTVTLTGAKPGAVLGWSAGLTATGPATGIAMHQVAGMGYTYRALVPAQTLSADTKVTFVQTTTGKTINMSYPGVASAVLAAKAAHTYSVTLGWGIDPEHVYAVGDVYPHVGPAVGIVFYIESGGKHGKVVGLQETTGRWGFFGKDEQADGVTGIRSTTDGKTATRNLIEKRNGEANFSTDYAIFNWIYQTMNGGNLDGVWYLPARDELSALYNAKANVNTGLSAISGAAQLSTNWYWSSSEFDLFNAWVVGFSDGTTLDGLKNRVNYRVRCVLAF